MSLELAPEFPHPHPFIHDDNWVGVPWQKKTPEELKHERLLAEGLGPKGRREKEAFDNATQVYALQERLKNREQPFFLNEEARKGDQATKGNAPVFPNAKRSLDKKKAQHVGAKEDAVFEINPFVEALKQQKLPIKFELPIRWRMPVGFSVKNLDAGYYLPLCVHGVRDQGDFLGTQYGEAAFQMARDIIHVHGRAGRLVLHMKSLAAPFREAIAKAANPEMTPTLELSYDIAKRALTLLRLLFNCDRFRKESASALSNTSRFADDRELLHGAVGELMFDAKFPLFSLLAGPLVSLRTRVIESNEYHYKESIALEYSKIIFETLDDFHTKGSEGARAAITASFTAGYSM